MKNDSLKKLSRIVSLLKLLEDGGFTVNNAAGNLYVSTRTIQRDIRVIEQAGFPIYSPSRGNFAFVEGFSLNKTRLDAKEASLMVFFADMATALGPSFAKSFKGIQQKLLSAEADSPYFIKMPKTKGYPDNDVTNKIAAAITNRKKVLLKYWKDGKLLDYDASPLKIANYEGFWYLLCLNKSGTFRTHRLGKFVYCEPTGQNFTPPQKP